MMCESKTPFGFIPFIFRRRGAVSLQPKGRPVFTGGLGLRSIASGCVSSRQVRPVQMSRMVFSFTPYSLAKRLALGFSAEDLLSDILKISIALSLVSTACGFGHWFSGNGIRGNLMTENFTF